MKRELFMSALALTALLVACGGDDDEVVPVADQVPASALASPQAFSSFVGAVMADDEAEPLSLANVEPPTSETDEPIEVI